MFHDASSEEINKAIESSWTAFQVYRQFSLNRRAEFMHAVAKKLDSLGDELLQTAHEETHLPMPRLKSEKARTIFQLNNYADACERGEWLEARIDTAMPDRNPPKSDLRKMLIPLGPVAVFGAANFPFAYSTAGGDTACALAAGCPVIVKSHPAHALTSEMVASAILEAAKDCNMPEGVFSHLHGSGNEVGEAIIKHPRIKAVGFTGSFMGGKQLFDWANQRKEPIPVFAEMSSINPVFLLPIKMKQSAVEVAKLYASSITLGVGQFCTNPGLIIGVDNDDLEIFIQTLGGEIKHSAPGDMLHTGIFKNYVERRANALAQQEVQTVAASEIDPLFNQGTPTIASATAKAFINNPILHQEVFGPYSIVIRCKDIDEMLEVTRHIEGQLTATLMATEEDLRSNQELVELVKNICGRFIFNGVPTGVEVCLSMQHGGPFPATTDSRFTSVGADGIKRFARPICYQNWPDSLLPEELKDENPLNIYRTVNDRLTKDLAER
ncbi:MAG TPA: aldehyde dehydrogenase (NADP(+)) [Chitinophagaceae bacterium]